jgi:hypothetical protein
MDCSKALTHINLIPGELHVLCLSPSLLKQLCGNKEKTQCNKEEHPVYVTASTWSLLFPERKIVAAKITKFEFNVLRMFHSKCTALSIKDKPH